MSRRISSPTYPKFQPVLPGFLFRRVFPLLDPPRCVSCGRLASSSVCAARELVYSTRRARIVYGSLPSPAPPALSYAKSTFLLSPTLSLVLFLSLSCSLHVFPTRQRLPCITRIHSLVRKRCRACQLFNRLLKNLP